MNVYLNNDIEIEAAKILLLLRKGRDEDDVNNHEVSADPGSPLAVPPASPLASPPSSPPPSQMSNEIPIGSGRTTVPSERFDVVNWSSYAKATRTLLVAVFTRRVLATHSLTGKKSPAFQDKPAKMCLDPKKIADVVLEIKNRFGVKENLIRTIITTKCADECKMLRMKQKRRRAGLT